jgi:lysophospholipase L1-like esterase
MSFHSYMPKVSRALLLFLLSLFSAIGAAQFSTHWVGSWAASQQEPEPHNALSADDLKDATLRQVVHLSIGGTELRVRLSNRFGTAPLHFAAVHIARPTTPGNIDPATDKALTFSGKEDVIIPAGAEYISDSLPYPVAAMSDLAITLRIDLPPSRQTGHPGSRATSYIAHGNQVSAQQLADAKRVEHWYFIAGVDVATSPQADAVVVLGDSITDGHGATTDGNNRWPDLLVKRLQANAATQAIAVLNHGIGGNRLLLDGLGPNALARFDPDVLAQAGVRYLIVLEGVNDLGMLAREHEVPREEHDALVHRIEGAYEQMIVRARTHGIRVIGCTILPYVGSEFYHPGPTSEADRQAVNDWIRAPGHFDAVVDFDKGMRDPEHPDRLLPAFDSGDHLHPSPAGYSAMADAVPLSLFDLSLPHWTAEQDHQRILDLLHLPALRRGPDGDPKSANAANFDESRVTRYSLPDPLKLNSGKKVTNAELWWKQRRPEIVEEFDREVYGRVPQNMPKVNWEVVNTVNESVGNVPVITKKLLGHVDNSGYPLISVDIQLTLTVPARASGPVPVMMEFGLSPEILEMLKKRLPAAQLAAFFGAGPTWQEQVLAKGWGYAILIPTSVQADNGDGLTQGIIGLVNHGQPRKLDDWGALRAWAWGASRALDYFETDKSVDAKQVGIEGLSRYGKAALVTMAYDSRFAIGFIGSSGAGGAKILRRNFGEQVENLASTSEYHWFDGNFLKYAGPLTVNDLPVDAHELIALCAPRPVFISSGSQQAEGGWVDAKGMFLGAAGAGPVYKLLGKKDLGTSEFPAMETALIDGDIAFRQHRGGHTTGPNWPTFLKFASRYMSAPTPAK